MIEVKVFQTHDNTFSLQIATNNAPIDLIATGVTRMVVKIGTSNQVDSNVNPEAIDWITGGSEGDVEFIFASLGLPLGIHRSQLVIYDGAHPLGQVIGNMFQIEIFPHVVLI